MNKHAKKCLSSAHIGWVLSAKEWLDYWISRKAKFTSADLMPTLAKTHDKRAIGGIIQAAYEAGRIKPTGRWMPTGSHGRPQREWAAK
jgi:hypothetical protein